ncbi:Protein PRY2 [Paramyrothecium foliicola]|nr:Protein PRY2 [Paramyrothecium foliicola]
MLPTFIVLTALLLGPAAAETVTVTAPPSIPSEEPEFVDDDTFTSAILNSTNTFRTQHNASDLSWNDTLAEFAVDYLEEADCEFEHSGGPYGENLAIGYPNTTASIEAWGNERDKYDFGDAEFDEETGHFTQLVWKNTTDVGCGRRLCGERGWYLACEYWPRGNVAEQFEAEVEEQEGTAGISKPSSLALVAAVAAVLLAAV